MFDRARRFLWVPLLFVLAAVIFVFNVSKVGGNTRGCLEGCAGRHSGLDGVLRIVSLNMLHGYPGFDDLPLRINVIEKELDRLDADLVLLQEVPWRAGEANAAETLAEALRMNYIYLRANGNRRLSGFEEGEAILSRFPMDRSEHVELKPRAGFFEHRIALSAVIKTPWGDLPVFVTHLTNGRPDDNLGQSRSLKAFVESGISGPAVVAGDFNAPPISPQIEALASTWADLGARLLEQDGFTCCLAELNDPSPAGLTRRIDYIFIVPGIDRQFTAADFRHIFDEPTLIDDGWQWASDHVGLLAELSMRP